MNNRDYHLYHAPIIVRLYHIDIETSMIWQRISVKVGCNYHEEDHVLVDYILGFVLDVDRVLSIMPNALRVICTLLIKSIKLRSSVHWLGYHCWI